MAFICICEALLVNQYQNRRQGLGLLRLHERWLRRRSKSRSTNFSLATRVSLARYIWILAWLSCWFGISLWLTKSLEILVNLELRLSQPSLVWLELCWQLLELGYDAFISEKSDTQLLRSLSPFDRLSYIKVFPDFLESLLDHFLFDELASELKVFSACKIRNFCYFIFLEGNLKAISIESGMTCCSINIILKIFC